MRVQKNGTIVGTMQSEDPVKLRLQVKLDEEILEQRVKPFPQSEQERMTQQMTEKIAKQLRGGNPRRSNNGARLSKGGRSPSRGVASSRRSSCEAIDWKESKS